MGSSRLAGKVLMKVDDTDTLASSVISQLSHCKLLDEMVLATTTGVDDDELVKMLAPKIKTFRGSATNVLDRFYQCALTNDISTIIRITCDNPLIDPTLVDDAILQFRSKKYDHVTNFAPRTFPKGTEVEVFSFQALSLAWTNAKTPYEQEHVTPYIYNNPTRFKILNISHTPDLSGFRWTVDTSDDLCLVRQIFAQIRKRPILMTDILEFLERN